MKVRLKIQLFWVFKSNDFGNPKKPADQRSHGKDPAKTSPEAKKKYSARFDQIDKEVRDHIAGLCKQFPNSALATFANFTLSVPTPDFSKEIPENTPNRDFEIQKKEYLFSKAHYWDNTNFQDSTLIRTPIFKSKLDEFFNTRVLMIPG